jgi:hypothetical protein
MPPVLASFLSVVPKVMVVAEQEASHNDASFRRRFAGAQHYNVAMYNSVAATAHRWLAEVELAVLGNESRDVLLREGAAAVTG